MNFQCQEEQNSNDYMEFIFREGPLARNVLDSIEDYCITRINEKWSLVSANIRGIVDPTFEMIGYSSLPNIYGLSDVGAVSAGGIPAVREQPVLGLFGQGTYIAIIDTGINWRHEAFINADGTSRIKLIWDQEANRVYTQDEINQALSGEDVFIPGDEIGHGTFLAGIAAGNLSRENNFSGVATRSELIIVKLRQAKKFLRDFYILKPDVPAYSEADIMRGVEFVSQYIMADTRPVSYCLGIGSSLTNHAGTSPLCDLLADEAEKVGQCITVSTGNQGSERLHFAGRVTNETPERVEIRVGVGENGFTCELWALAPEVYSVEIISPSGQIISRIPSRSGISTRLSFIFENTIIYVYYKQYESMSGQNILVLRFKNPSAGIWALNVYGRDLTTGLYDIWIMNREFLSADTYFLRAENFITVTDPANVPECIAVSAYDYRSNSLYSENGRGFTIYDVVKPDFCAPGVDIICPQAIGTSGYQVVSGTSVAAAYYAGMAALIQEYGFLRNRIPYLRTSEIKNITLSGCIRKEGITYPSRDWGYGTVNLYNSIENMRRD